MEHDLLSGDPDAVGPMGLHDGILSLRSRGVLCRYTLADRRHELGDVERLGQETERLTVHALADD